MFIVLEGLDGAGKSTQLKALEDYYTQRDKKVRFMHFPRYDTPVYGDLIARFLRGDCGAIDAVDPYLVSLLFAGNRSEIAPQIKQWLDDGYVVLLDRYVYSNVAFQGAKLKTLEERTALAQWIFQTEYNYFRIPKPDLNLFLDVPLDFIEAKLKETRQGDDRAYLHGKQDIHEASVSFQQMVRQVYLEQSRDDATFQVVSCCNAQGGMAGWDEIFERIIPYIK